MLNNTGEKTSLGKRNRQKGHHAERFYADVFKKLGYKHCVTARLGGRIFDNAGIDIIFIPFNIQIKAGKQTGMSPGKVLLQMDAQIKSLFPEDHAVRNYPLFVIHRINPFSTSYKEDLVYMTHKEFLLLKLNKDLIVSRKVRKLRMSTDFGDIISIKFSDLINQEVFNIKEDKHEEV